MGGNLLNLQYQYDNVGNISQLTDLSRNEVQLYEYDHLHRLMESDISPITNTFQDTFDSLDTSNWVFSGHQAIVSESGNNVIRNTGSNTGWTETFYRNSYSLTDGEVLEVRFKLDNTNTAVFSIESGDVANQTYKRFGINTYNGNIYAQYMNDGVNWVYPGNLITNMQLNTWYVLRIEVHDSQPGFLVKVHQESNPTITGSYHVNMASGQAWRFRTWMQLGNAYLDDYLEFDDTSSQIRSYQYDEIGNITSLNGNTYSYPTSGASSVRPHAVSSVSTLGNFIYDANGNMISRSENGTDYTQDWTSENKLKQVTWNSGANSVSYSYDGDSSRLTKTEGGATTIYIGNYYEQTGSEIVKYYYFGAERVAMRDSSEVYYFHNDHLGTASLTTNISGTVQHQSRQHPYGSQRWTAGADKSDYDYTGQRKEGFGLLDYNARYYSPSLGRFISPDSIVPGPGNPQSFNRYSYVLNNPLKYVDLTGHCIPGTCPGDTAEDQDVSVPNPSAIMEVVRTNYVQEHRLGWISRYTKKMAGLAERGSVTDLEALARITEYAAPFYGEGGREVNAFVQDIGEVLVGHSGPFAPFKAEGPFKQPVSKFSVYGSPGLRNFQSTGFDILLQDNSNQLRHFWFAVEIEMYYPTELNKLQGILHETSILSNNPSGQSPQDILLSFMGSSLGEELDKGTVRPSEVGDWVRTNLGWQ